MSLLDRDRAVLWHPYTQMKMQPPLLPVVRAEGVYLYTEDGRKILDGISSWWVNIHGHSHPKLNEALARQAREVEHVLFAGCTHRPAVELAEKLVAVTPPGLTKVFFSDNGSTAVEVALKMALQYWRNRGEARRTRFITLTNSYHGDTVGAMSASDDSVFTAAFRSLLFRVEHVADLDAMARTLQEMGDEIAGVMIEPMLQGAGGMIVWPKEFVAGVRRLCDEHGVLLIADEVMTGFGRTGKMFACEHAGVSPDLMCLSKALTGGYLPLGATLATEAIYDAFYSDDRTKTFFHGHSFTANPLACAVASASLDLFREQPVLEWVARLESDVHEGLQPLREMASIRDIRGIGGVGIIELADGEHGGGYLHELGPTLYRAFLQRGLLLRPLGNILYFMPPYTISREETHWALTQIREVLSALSL